MRINTTLRRPEQLHFLLLRVMCVFWFAGKLMSHQLWLSDRLFPTAPVWTGLNAFPAYLHLGLFALSLWLLAMAFVSGLKYMPVLQLLLVSELLSCLLDQNRWQPWEYQYIFTLFIFIVHARNKKLIPVALSFVLAATYMYSGLNKFNEGFLQLNWGNMILHRFFRLPMSVVTQPAVHFSGYLIGITELLAGVGLLFSTTRKWSAWFLIGMHLFILSLLGPWGLKFNSVVWPWNVAMIMYLFSLFIATHNSVFSFRALLQGWNKVVLVFWGVLPAMNFIGCWDSYLSASLYSERIPQMSICIADTTQCPALSPYFSTKDSRNSCNGQAKIDLSTWSMKELNVPINPELRIYKNIQAKLLRQYPAAGLSFVYFSTIPNKPTLVTP